MLLKAVRYARPDTVEEAVELLGKHENARPLAGGQTLINVMKVRAAAPDVLVDLGALDALRAISRDDDDRRSGRRAGGRGRGVLPGRVLHGGVPGRAADEDHDPGEVGSRRVCVGDDRP